MNLSDTVSLLELMVFIIGVVGLGLSALLMAVYMGDRGRIKAGGGNTVSMRMANGNLRNELGRAYIEFGYIALAIYAMTTPPPIRPANARFGDALTYLLVSFQVATIGASLWDYVDRRRNQDALQSYGDYTNCPDDCQYKKVVEKVKQVIHGDEDDRGDYIDWPPSGPINKGD